MIRKADRRPAAQTAPTPAVLERAPGRVAWQPAVTAAALLAGFAAMMEQLVWFRLMGTALGSDVWGASLVLAAFLAGLGLGSARASFWSWGGRLTPARGFAAAQFVLALFAVGSPWIFEGLQSVYRLGAAALPAAVDTAVLRPLAALLLLLVPSFAMGATVPLLASAETAGAARTSRLYASNNLGGLLGVLAAGLFLVPALGLPKCLAISALCHAAAALTGLRARPLPAESRPETRPAVAAPAFFAALGFAVAGLEVVWMRVLAARYLEVTIYSFTCVVASVILGLTLGSALGASFKRERGGPWPARWCALLVPLWTLGAWCLLPRLAEAIGAWLPAEGGAFWTWRHSLIAEALMAAMPLALPAAFQGFAFRWLLGPEAGPTSGRLLSWGSLAAALGALAAGLLFIPIFGNKGALLALCVPPLLAFAAFDRFKAGLAAVLAAALGLAAQVLPEAAAPQPGDAVVHRVLYHEESAGAAVSVWEDFVAEDSQWQRTMLVDGHPVAGTGRLIQSAHKLLAHIPMLLHPQPKKALNVGLGTGGTARSMLLHGAEVTCFEILPAVRRAAEHFPDNNAGLFKDPRFRLEFGDARHLMSRTPERFDVIVGDVTDLHYLGNANLFSRDYLAAGKERLAEGGVFALWLPREPGRENLRVIFATFLSVFPRATLWYPYDRNSHFALLVALPEGGPAVSWSRWKERAGSGAVAEDLASIGSSDPLRLAAYLALGPEQLAAFAAGAEVHSDLRPILDFSAPKSARSRSTDLLQEISLRRPTSDALSLPEEAARAYRPGRERALAGYLALSEGRHEDALRAAQEARRASPADGELAANLDALRLAALFSLADQEAASGRASAAAAHLRAALNINKDHFTALNNLGLLELHGGRPRQAAELFSRALTVLPEAESTRRHMELALARLAEGAAP